MSEPFVSIHGRGRLAHLCVEDKCFPLTQMGCVEAGRYLRSIGVDKWLCGSSVDFPGEYKEGSQLDVRSLMQEGWEEEK